MKTRTYTVLSIADLKRMIQVIEAERSESTGDQRTRTFYGEIAPEENDLHGYKQVNLRFPLLKH